MIILLFSSPYHRDSVQHVKDWFLFFCFFVFQTLRGFIFLLIAEGLSHYLLITTLCSVLFLVWGCTHKPCDTRVIFESTNIKLMFLFVVIAHYLGLSLSMFWCRNGSFFHFVSSLSWILLQLVLTSWILWIYYWSGTLLLSWDVNILGFKELNLSLQESVKTKRLICHLLHSNLLNLLPVSGIISLTPIFAHSFLGLGCWKWQCHHHTDDVLSAFHSVNQHAINHITTSPSLLRETHDWQGLFLAWKQYSPPEAHLHFKKKRHIRCCNLGRQSPTQGGSLVLRFI